MGGGSADRAGKPKTNNVRIEGLCFELPSEIASFDGKRASEWKISVGYLSGTSGSSTRGIVLEVSPDDQPGRPRCLRRASAAPGSADLG